MSKDRFVQPTKRLAADVPNDIFWEIKSATADKKLQMKEMIPLAVVKFLNLPYTVEQLGLSETLEDYLDEEAEDNI